VNEREISMKLAMIGLGKMGMNMARRLMPDSHEITAYDLSKEAVQEITAEGATGAASLQQVVEMLSAPRIVWIMLPAGKAVENTINQLKELLSSEDIIIDGGNTYYKDDLRRFEALKTAGIHYMDVGVSGGIWGLKVGYLRI
jgi:6-phosphogluconate dehydrogenase